MRKCVQCGEDITAQAREASGDPYCSEDCADEAEDMDDFINDDTEDWPDEEDEEDE